MKQIRLYFAAALSVAVCILSSCASPPPPVSPNYRLDSRAELDSVLFLLKKNPDNFVLNVTAMVYYTEHRMPQELIQHAEPVFERACAQQNKPLMLYSGAYIAQILLLERNSKRVGYFLEKIRDQADSTNDDFIKALINNISGVYAMKEEVNYPEALSNFKTAYKIIAKKNNRANMCALLCNIASIYHCRRDTTGFQYAYKAYKLGQQTNSDYFRFISTLQLANMYEIKNDCTAALKYACEAEAYAQNNTLSLCQLYTLYGNIYTARSEYTLAEENFQKALQLLQIQPGAPWETTYLGYGKMLHQSGRYREAMKIFREGLNLNGSECSAEHKHTLLLALSETADSLELEKQALKYYKAYQQQMHQVFNIRQEERFQELVTENARIQLQNEIQHQKLELEISRRRNFIMWTVLIIVTVLLLISYFFYRKQNKLYRKMVEHHHTLLNAEQNRLPQKERPKSSTKSRDQELWDKLVKLMDEEHLYREKDISLEKIGELLATNRTYTSKVLNQFSGESFYSYIHKKRIREASVILSDPALKNTSLKELAYSLGYNSLSSFYRAFQREIGCPPSKYRIIVQEIECK